jgi:hypothetical protein
VPSRVSGPPAGCSRGTRRCKSIRNGLRPPTRPAPSTGVAPPRVSGPPAQARGQQHSHSSDLRGPRQLSRQRGIARLAVLSAAPQRSAARAIDHASSYSCGVGSAVPRVRAPCTIMRAATQPQQRCERNGTSASITGESLVSRDAVTLEV